MTANQELAEQIEELVRNHIAASRAAAATAMERAFGATGATRSAGDHAQGATGMKRTRAKPAPRRGVEEVAALEDQFYAVVCRNPGETMVTLAPQVGASPRALHVAVARLKQAGRVRAVGQRQFTRYFPMTATAAAAA